MAYLLALNKNYSLLFILNGIREGPGGKLNLSETKEEFFQNQQESDYLLFSKTMCQYLWQVHKSNYPIKHDHSIHRLNSPSYLLSYLYTEVL